MKRTALYSRSPRSRGGAARPVATSTAPQTVSAAAVSPSPVEQAASGSAQVAPPRWSGLSRIVRDPRMVWGVWCLLAGLWAGWAVFSGGPRLRALTQQDIDAAVRQSLEKEPLPSAYAKAAAAIAPSVVRVQGLMNENDTGDDSAELDEKKAMERSLGTGVVIVDNGTILTNLHVVWGAKRIRVRFHNGHESEAVVVGMQAENDLAVLKATSLPDDLQAATIRSTADLAPGDQVIAVGHPFGIGPSVSAGVVSGLQREFRDREGNKTLSKLIQFDAAANPGNSGGPLVTMDGHVVGIVTAIFNPTAQRTFVGIGFAVPIESAASAVGLPPF